MSQTETINKDRLREIYGDNFIDVTDRIECYEHGKTFECDCGQGIGVEFGVVQVHCPSCHMELIDTEADSRSSPERQQGQTSLGQW